MENNRNNKLGYVEFRGEVFHILDLDNEFKEDNETLLHDIVYSVWEDYSSLNNSHLLINDYVRILHILLVRVCMYGMKC